jgi:hypothetical protein
LKVVEGGSEGGRDELEEEEDSPKVVEDSRGVEESSLEVEEDREEVERGRAEGSGTITSSVVITPKEGDSTSLTYSYIMTYKYK